MNDLPNCVPFEKISDELNGDEENAVYVCEICGKSIGYYDKYYDLDGQIRCNDCGEEYVKEKYIHRAGI